MPSLIQHLDLGTGAKRVVVKDSIDIAGYPTQAGSAALADAPAAERHAEIVERTLVAGYRIVGKANLHELAFGMTGLNAWTGTPENPRFPALIPGGSSSGSAAAVAAGLAEIGIGTDTGGSIRVPAACCGVYGLKPTFGRLSRRGVMPAYSSLDCVGPLSATIEELIDFMSSIDAGFSVESSEAVPRICTLDVAADVAILGTLEAYLEAAGLAAEKRALPLMGEAFDAAMALINRETYMACGVWLDSGRLGKDVERRLRGAAKTSEAELCEAEAVRQTFAVEVDRLFETCEVLALPTLPHFPLSRAPAEEGQQDLTISSLVRPFNLSGHPALSLPMPPNRGRPVSLQLVGRRGDDAGLCRAACYLVKAQRDTTIPIIGDIYAQPGR
ncbi:MULTISPECIES: amidase [unclassified Halomonas]|uniref:amidase n=1 Tax=unclassified Halomonas TaxID=2609666 RepID=UPI0006DBCEF0|nr:MULTISPECIES: amidase [unclassified Halomonas]KPQ30902.1 MAG: amidase [Halomonas sp. HL-93]SBR52814.1 amidase [Halomonas sp. HL-93]SNY97812.1 amidase [Halomonas sp. hl-4]